MNNRGKFHFILPINKNFLLVTTFFKIGKIAIILITMFDKDLKKKQKKLGKKLIRFLQKAFFATSHRFCGITKKRFLKA
jgi:hypothetical protein